MAARDEGTVHVQQRPPGRELHRRRRRVQADRLRVLGQQRRLLRARQRLGESNLALEQLDELVDHYYGRPLRNKVARACGGSCRVRLDSLGLDPGRRVSEIDFDFWEWGMEKYVRAVDEFDGPDFERLLEDVKRAD